MGGLPTEAQRLMARISELKVKISETIGPKTFFWLKGKIKDQDWRQFKGSLRDPLLYLETIAIILFGVAVFATPSFFGDVNSPILIHSSQNGGDPFIIPGTKVKESPALSLIQKNSLAAISPPIMVTEQVLGALVEAAPFEEARREIIEYIVADGDSLWSIATKFNISLDTIVWANNIQSALIRPGQKLLILPVSGVMHLVEAGDTVSGLAEKYKTDAEKIIAFNDLMGGGDLFEGEVLIIPGGQMLYPTEIQPVALARLSTNNFYGQSHAYPYGQCTWWVAQKRAVPAWGNAKDWLNNAGAAGYPVCRGRYCIPQFGAVIALQGHRLYGHVGYVEQVRGDKVVFSEMNYIGWGRMNYRTLKIGDPLIVGYIY